METYGALFGGAPQFFDYVLMNPPFGGKEGKEAQTNYEYRTGATQILFLQDVMKSMRAGSHCGIVLDEGVLFRTNEGGFVSTKRKLLEECDVYCIVSLPGGVFASAGAGVKTNLVFFKKGRQTESIWYYDLSDIKVGKKLPFTQARFDEFFELLPIRGDSERSWTVPFADRLQSALEEARPFREEAAKQFVIAKSLEDRLREGRRSKSTTAEQLVAVEEELKAVVRAAREAKEKADSIENTVYDLKAVNPTRTDNQDKRTPSELLNFIEERGREADAALARLRERLDNPG
jgi:type I restriction enzyme M protein